MGVFTPFIPALIWALAVGDSDNIIHPFIIKREADPPILLIFVGVVGGLIAFGIVGLFIGPVILAVTYALLKAWINENKSGTAKTMTSV